MTQSKQQWMVIISLVIVSVLFLGAIVILQNLLREEQTSFDTTDYRGTVYDPPQILTDFTLPASTGQELSLSDLHGQWVLMFFGYTHCPDVCPITLGEFRQVKTKLGEDANAVTFLFISVDGPRDTPELLENYVTRFDPDFIGMSGSDEVLALIGPDYGLYYELHTEDGTDDNYLVDHTGRSYLIDPQGMLRISYAYGTESDIIAETIRELMN